MRNDKDETARRSYWPPDTRGSRPRFEEIDRENPSHEFWHPHQIGRDFNNRSDSTGYGREDRTLQRETWHQDEYGLYRGKGPRSYRRRDDRILEDINDRFCDNPYLNASEIDVEVQNGDVILSGTVDDRDSKRLAADIGDSISGVKNVENRLRVKKTGI